MRHRRVIRRLLTPVLTPVLALVLASAVSAVAAPPASAWHDTQFTPPAPTQHIDNLSVTVGRRAWVLTVRAEPVPIEYYSWYLDTGDDGPGQHRGAEFLLVSAPGDLQLFTLPSADPSAIGAIACDQVKAVPLRSGRPGEKVRIAQACLGSPDRLRVRLSASAGEDSYSWSPGPRRTDFHDFVDNVARPVTVT